MSKSPSDQWVEKLKSISWWRHPMQKFSALLALCAGNSPVTGEFPVQSQWALMFSLICAWTNGWVNNREVGDMRRHRTHYDVTVMIIHSVYLCQSVLNLRTSVVLCTGVVAGDPHNKGIPGNIGSRFCTPGPLPSSTTPRGCSWRQYMASRPRSRHLSGNEKKYIKHLCFVCLFVCFAMVLYELCFPYPSLMATVQWHDHQQY